MEREPQGERDPIVEMIDNYLSRRRDPPPKQEINLPETEEGKPDSSFQTLPPDHLPEEVVDTALSAPVQLQVTTPEDEPQVQATPVLPKEESPVDVSPVSPAEEPPVPLHESQPDDVPTVPLDKAEQFDMSVVVPDFAQVMDIPNLQISMTDTPDEDPPTPIGTIGDDTVDEVSYSGTDDPPTEFDIVASFPEPEPQESTEEYDREWDNFLMGHRESH